METVRNESFMKLVPDGFTVFLIYKFIIRRKRKKAIYSTGDLTKAPGQFII